MTSAADGTREQPTEKPPRWPTVRVVYAGESSQGKWSVQTRQWWWPFWKEVNRADGTEAGRVVAIDRAKKLSSPPAYLA